MRDLTYLALTAAFFAVMLAYVRACASLGRGVATGNEAP